MTVGQKGLVKNQSTLLRLARTPRCASLLTLDDLGVPDNTYAELSNLLPLSAGGGGGGVIPGRPDSLIKWTKLVK